VPQQYRIDSGLDGGPNNVPDNPQHIRGVFELFKGQQATATISGQWNFSKDTSCGAAGFGGPIGDNSFPVPMAPPGCCFWYIGPGQDGAGNQDTTGWFTANNQTITWGNTSPGYGVYSFRMNDNNYTDNSGFLTLTVTIEPIQELDLKKGEHSEESSTTTVLILEETKGSLR
jgi:hypothetical protein